MTVDPLSVACPQCGATPGATCRLPGSGRLPRTPHVRRAALAARWEAAAQARIDDRESERRATRVRLYRLLGHSAADAERLAGAQNDAAGRVS